MRCKKKKNDGYRDVQVAMNLRGDPDAIDQGIGHHIVEVQLHLRAIYECKKEAGHEAYIVARNLRSD